MTLEGHDDWVTSVTFSIDGNYIISGSDDCTIRIWATRTGEAVGQPLTGHSHWVKSVTVSPDGKWIATGSAERTVRIWSTSTLSEVHLLKGHSDWVRSVAFSHDSAFLFSGSEDKTIRVWDVQTGKAVGDPLMGHTHHIRSVTFAPNSSEFASGSEDGAVYIWDARTRTDPVLYKQSEDDYSELNEEELRTRLNVSRASLANAESDGWIRDGEKLLF